tara:strand:- start:95 stop:274 length:180 start_codon:yes stop_codon:yes gene_type:complete
MGFFSKLLKSDKNCKQVLCQHKEHKEYNWGEMLCKECLKCGYKDVETLHKGRIVFKNIN